MGTPVLSSVIAHILGIPIVCYSLCMCRYFCYMITTRESYLPWACISYLIRRMSSAQARRQLLPQVQEFLFPRLPDTFQLITLLATYSQYLESRSRASRPGNRSSTAILWLVVPTCMNSALAVLSFCCRDGDVDCSRIRHCFPCIKPVLRLLEVCCHSPVRQLHWLGIHNLPN